MDSFFKEKTGINTTQKKLLSKLEWELGPFSGLGIFAASFNPLWLLEKGKDLFSHKAKIEPLQRYRDDPEW